MQNFEGKWALKSLGVKSATDWWKLSLCKMITKPANWIEAIWTFLYTFKGNRNQYKNVPFMLVWFSVPCKLIIYTTFTTSLFESRIRILKNFWGPQPLLNCKNGLGLTITVFLWIVKIGFFLGFFTVFALLCYHFLHSSPSPFCKVN